jgi:hypothetical protein
MSAIWKSVKKKHIFADVSNDVSSVPIKEAILKLGTIPDGFSTDSCRKSGRYLLRRLGFP